MVFIYSYTRMGVGIFFKGVYLKNTEEYSIMNLEKKNHSTKTYGLSFSLVGICPL